MVSFCTFPGKARTLKNDESRAYELDAGNDVKMAAVAPLALLFVTLATLCGAFVYTARVNEREEYRELRETSAMDAELLAMLVDPVRR